MSKQERIIREKRTIEAVKKNMMGQTGKLGTIVKYLGYPVIRQGSGLFDQSFLDDPFAHPIEDLPTSEDLEVYQEGYIFDGLSRGMHIEIKYENADRRIWCTYKGYPVYFEISGELESYAPFSDWEDLIERLYKAAKAKKKKLELSMEPVIEEAAMARKQSLWQKMRLKWGV